MTSSMMDLRIMKIPERAAWEGLTDSDISVDAEEVPPIVLRQPMIISVRGVRLRMTLVGMREVPSWVNSLFALLRLPKNWDSYGSRQIDLQCVLAAIDLMNKISVRGFPTPNIAPLSGSGVQLEWCLGRRELEVAIASPARYTLLFEDENEVVETGGRLADDRPIFQKLEHLCRS